MNAFSDSDRVAALVHLRPLREDDFARFHAYRSDPNVARYQGWWPMNEDKARAFLHEQSAQSGIEPGRWGQFAITDPTTDCLLGDVGLWQSHDRRKAEIGITVAPQEQGRGVGRSAMRAALLWLFSDPVLEHVQANADARNLPCRRMLAAVGFREIGTADVFVKEEACIEHQYRVQRDVLARISEETC
jgi:RimJ/RimL family protein N-acetyltransferase